MSERLFLEPPIELGIRRLDAKRSHYLCRVLRKREGDLLWLFDGQGREFEARLQSAAPKGCEVNILHLQQQLSAPDPELHLLCGLIKPAAMDQVMQRSTELGVTDLWPLTSDFSTARKSDPSPARMEHWRRIIENAAEQCGQLHLPRLHEKTSLFDHFRNPPAEPLVMDLLCAPLPPSWPQRSTALIIGPEGGWSEAERQQFDQRNWPRHGLGDLTLRAETAPMAALAILGHIWRTTKIARPV